MTSNSDDHIAKQESFVALLDKGMLTEESFAQKASQFGDATPTFEQKNSVPSSFREKKPNTLDSAPPKKRKYIVPCIIIYLVIAVFLGYFTHSINSDSAQKKLAPTSSAATE